MSLWPFSKNKKDQSGYSATDVRSDDDVWIDDDYIDDDDVPADEDYIDDEYSDDYSDDDYPDESYADNDYPEDDYSEDDYSDEDDVDYEVDEGDVGPFDGDTVPFEDFDFSDFSRGTLSLGSLKIPLPLHSEVQVEMDGNGPRMLHIVTPYGRITPVAFAAPRSEGQWRQTTKELAEGMRNDGLIVHIEHGPWGREIVGLAPEATIRIIGADGPRWMLRMTIAAPNATADQMTELGRDVVARTFVYRGDEPIFAGQPLPVSLPDKLAKKVQQATEKRQKDKNNAAETSPDKAAEAATPTAAAETPQQQEPVQERTREQSHRSREHSGQIHHDHAQREQQQHQEQLRREHRHELRENQQERSRHAYSESAPPQATPLQPTPPTPATDITQMMPRQTGKPQREAHRETHSDSHQGNSSNLRQPSSAPAASPTPAPTARSQGGKRRARTVAPMSSVSASLGSTATATATSTRNRSATVLDGDRQESRRGRHALGAETASVTTSGEDQVSRRGESPSAESERSGSMGRRDASRMGAEGSALQQMRSER